PARSTSTSAICGRRSSATPRTRSTCSPCAESATASATPSPREAVSIGPRAVRTRRLRLSLRNRLALFFFVVTLLAIGSLYLYVAPGLQTRLIHERLHQLASDAHRGAPR